MENQKIDNQLNLAMSVEDKLRSESQELNAGFDAETKRWELIVKYSGDITRYATEEIEIEELIAGYAIVTLPEQMLPVFAKIEEIEYIEKPKRIFPQVERSLAASCFGAVLSPERFSEGLDGDGVYIAVIDSGIDYTLPAFRSIDGKTKIVWLWDQRTGKEYSSEDINVSLEAGTTPLSTDVTGHGTAVASIAAQGAPGSQFIIVKLDTENQESYPTTTSLMRAFTYVLRKTEEQGRPVAINLSFGNTYGAHDGTSLLERFIDNVSEMGQNVICVGSGNEGDSGGHFSGLVEKEERIELAVGNYEQELSLQIWKNYADVYEVSVVSPGGENYIIGRQEEDGGAQQVVLEQTRLLIFSGKPQPYRTKEEIYIDFLPDGGNYINQGVWQIVLKPQSIVNGNIQMYLPSEAVRSSGTRFLLQNPDRTMTIPATAQKVISVGAYQTFFGAYAPFSGRGFIADGFSKPDIVAPGVNITVQTALGEERVSGTSYATPFVTAAAALLMEWGIVRGNDPYLYGEKVKAYLIRGARRLPGFEEWPNDMAGWGALCVSESFPGE